MSFIFFWLGIGGRPYNDISLGAKGGVGVLREGFFWFVAKLNQLEKLFFQSG
jgi:hypothetical protein